MWGGVGSRVDGAVCVHAERHSAFALGLRVHLTLPTRPPSASVVGAHPCTDLTSPECSTGAISYTLRWVAKVTLPVAVMFLILLLAMIGILGKERAL